MNSLERFRTRVAEAFCGMMLTLVAIVVGIVIRSAREVAPATEPATSLSLNLMTGLAGFWMIVFGAGLVTAGVPIPWMKVLELFLDSGGRY